MKGYAYFQETYLTELEGVTLMTVSSSMNTTYYTVFFSTKQQEIRPRRGPKEINRVEKLTFTTVRDFWQRGKPQAFLPDWWPILDTFIISFTLLGH